MSVPMFCRVTDPARSMFNSGVEFNMSLKNTMVVGRFCGVGVDPVEGAEDIGPGRPTRVERLLHRGQGGLPRGLNRGIPSRCGLSLD